jgi:hypothetical protein
MAVPVDPLNAQPADEQELYRGDDGQQPRQVAAAEQSTTHWLGEIGVDIRSLATTIRHTASGVATFVHRSALTVAHEIARLEEEEEEEEEDHEENHHGAGPKSAESHDEKEASSSNNKKKEPVRLRLPWELLQELHDNIDHDSDESSATSGGILAVQPTPAFVEDGELKRRILLLSHDEKSFLQPHRQVLEEEETVLDAARIDLIQRLLRADSYLSIAHKNLQSSISEATFWCNYFEACSAARHKYLQDQLEALDQNNNEEEGVEDDDDEEDGTEEEEDSFVCIDASVKSYRSAGMRSVDSLVLVESSRFANSMKV